MKQGKYILFLTAFILIVGCGKSDKVFEQTAFSRIQKAKDELRQTLTQVNQGWEMIYFKQTLPLFSDMYRNIKGSDPYGFTLIERHYGVGGSYFLIKFMNDGTLQMLGNNGESFSLEEKQSQYTISQNTYLQLNFVSPNYIFQTGQSSFLFYKKNEDGSLVFVTGKYPNANSEYIVMRPIQSNQTWNDKMQKVLQTQTTFNKMWNSDRNAILKITDSYGNDVFTSTRFSSDPQKYINPSRKYVVFVKNMERHTTNSSYYTALGSGYVPLEDEILFLPGFKVSESVVFTRFHLDNGRYISQEKGYTAIIE